MRSQLQNLANARLKPILKQFKNFFYRCVQSDVNYGFQVKNLHFCPKMISISACPQNFVYAKNILLSAIVLHNVISYAANFTSALLLTLLNVRSRRLSAIRVFFRNLTSTKKCTFNIFFAPFFHHQLTSIKTFLADLGTVSLKDYINERRCTN